MILILLYLGEKKELKISPPITTRLIKLPYDDIEWPDFEKLCYQVLCDLYGSENCSFYGEFGQNQHGLDLYVRDGAKYKIFQCKQAKSFKKAQLIKAIGKWEGDKWFYKTSEFYLFSSNPLIETSFVNEFELQKK